MEKKKINDMNQLYAKIFGENNPHLIILHGIFGTGDNWNAIGKKLSENFTVHVLDVRNHGKSFHSSQMNYPVMANDVIDYLAHHQIKKTHIVGHSMGGKITMQSLLDYPDYFDKAVVIDIAPKKYSPQHNEVIVALQSLDLSVAKNRNQIDQQLSQFIPSEFVRQWLMKSIYMEDNAYRFRFNLEAILSNYSVLSNSILATKNASSPIPTLFIKGEKSDYIQLPDDLSLIESFFSNYQLTEIKNAGHWTQADKPMEVYKEILEFLV